MAAKRSAGILLYRRHGRGVEVLLAHMGGPFFQRRDAGAWTIPKGEHGTGEDPWEAAQREFAEELGHPAPPGDPLDLGVARQSGGKLVTAWAVEGDLDPDAIVAGTFTMEWPPGSGRMREFPEVDRVAWFTVDEARAKVVSGQRPLLDRLSALLGG